MAKRKSAPSKASKNQPAAVQPAKEQARAQLQAQAATSGYEPGKEGASGAYSNSAIAMMLPGQSVPLSAQEQALGVKIARAMLSGPRHITKDATVAEMGSDGQLAILRQGSNHWVCFPGDENQIGNPPMCADPMGLQWMMDNIARKTRPTNMAPGIIYMLCGATQHSNTDPFDRTSPAIPIGPHWMILWPFNAMQWGLPNTIRDAGAWVMFDGTPYAYLHICGSPWVGHVYNERDQVPIWTMVYGPRSEP